MGQAVRQFDTGFDHRLEEEWRQGLREGAGVVEAGYEE